MKTLTRSQNGHGKKEASETVMFSGLEAQSEISRLLDELYGRLDRVPLGKMAGRERCTPLRTTEGLKEVKGERKRESVGYFVLKPKQIRFSSFRGRNNSREVRITPERPVG